jgi:hypothetical protein
MRQTSIFFPILLVATLLSGVPQAQIPGQNREVIAASEAAFPLRAGVVVDPAAGLLYTMSDGGVEAVTLGGTVLWQSAAAARPLGMYGEFLIAQRANSEAGQLSVAFLNRLGVEVGGASLNLGSEVSASVVDGPHSQFRTDCNLQNGIPVFEWEYKRLRTGAVRGSSAAIGRVSSQANNFDPLGGAVSLNPESGAQQVLSSTPLRRRVSAKAPAPLNAGDFVPGALQAMHSVDRRHVLVTERVAPGEWQEYRWSIFDAQTQSKLGELPNRLGGARFFVVGSTIYFDSSPYTDLRDGSPEEHGLELLAMSLESGELVWARTIRDSRFYGPFPH